MWCIKCQCDVIECQCSDIIERLEELYDSALALAAHQNIEARKVLWDENLIYNNAT